MSSVVRRLLLRTQTDFLQTAEKINTPWGPLFIKQSSSGLASSASEIVVTVSKKKMALSVDRHLAKRQFTAILSQVVQLSPTPLQIAWLISQPLHQTPFAKCVNQVAIRLRLIKA